MAYNLKQLESLREEPLKHERLLKLLRYDRSTHTFVRLVRTSTKTHVGEIAGSTVPGKDAKIRVDNVPYPSAQLAWFYVYGVWFEGKLNFKDGKEYATCFEDIQPAKWVHTQETKDAIGKKHLGRKASDETKAKLSKLRKGTKIRPELLQKWSDCKKGELNGMYGTTRKESYTEPAGVRFLRNVPNRPKDPDQCWEWQGSRINSGHGNFRIVPGKIDLAHRYAYASTTGPIPYGMWVCHKCDNPPCVRPSHLFLGTPKDNTQDMISKGRARWQKPKNKFAGV